MKCKTLLGESIGFANMQWSDLIFFVSHECRIALFFVFISFNDFYDLCIFHQTVPMGDEKLFILSPTTTTKFWIKVINFEPAQQ